MEQLSNPGEALMEYPYYIPILCKKSKNEEKLTVPPYAEKKKYLVPTDFTVGEFIPFVQEQLKLPSKVLLFFFTENNILLKNNEKLKKI